MNSTTRPLPIANGAPLRVRIERQLGYKMAKYIMRIELVDRFDKIAGGKGGCREDQGYQWYAGVCVCYRGQQRDRAQRSYRRREAAQPT